MCGRKKVFAAETIEKVPEVVVKVWYNVNVISTSQIHNILFSLFIFYLFVKFLLLFLMLLQFFQSRITYGSKSQPQVKLAPTSDTCVVNLRFEIPQDLMVSFCPFVWNFDWILFWGFLKGVENSINFLC